MKYLKILLFIIIISLYWVILYKQQLHNLDGYSKEYIIAKWGGEIYNTYITQKW